MNDGGGEAGSNCYEGNGACEVDHDAIVDIYVVGAARIDMNEATNDNDRIYEVLREVGDQSSSSSSAVPLTDTHELNEI